MAPVLPQLLDGVRPFGSSEPQLWQAGLVLHSIMIFGEWQSALLWLGQQGNPNVANPFQTYSQLHMSACTLYAECNH